MRSMRRRNERLAKLKLLLADLPSSTGGRYHASTARLRPCCHAAEIGLSSCARTLGARCLLLEIGQRRHAAVWRDMVDDLRQHGRKLAQQLLLAPAGALRKFG